MVENRNLLPETKSRSITAFEHGWYAHQYSVSLSRKIQLPLFDTILKEFNNRIVDKSELVGRKGAVAGQYRTNTVFIPDAIYSFIPPLPQELPNLMRSFTAKVDQRIRTTNPKKVTEIEIGRVLDHMAFVHYWTTRIHPFREGNGRTAREVTGFLCKRFNLPSIFVGPIDKKEYVEALNCVDITAQVSKLNADLDPFVLFLAEKMLRSFPKNLSEHEQIRKDKLIGHIYRLKFQLRYKQSSGSSSKFEL